MQAGSSNSQDSFPPPGSNPSSMDGYGGYPSGYPPGAGPGYNEPPPMQRPPSQSNSQSPHSGTNHFIFVFYFIFGFFVFHFFIYIFTLINFQSFVLYKKKILNFQFIHIWFTNI